MNKYTNKIYPGNSQVLKFFILGAGSFFFRAGSFQFQRLLPPVHSAFAAAVHSNLLNFLPHFRLWTKQLSASQVSFNILQPLMSESHFIATGDIDCS